MEKGFFITIEGIEGAGKSTAIAAATESLTQLSVAHLLTREPGGTPFAEEIRTLLLEPREEKVFSKAELLLMYAARVQHVEMLIKPTLAKGIHVISDRFNDATFAYQGGGRGICKDKIAELDSWCLAELKPDLTLLLDLPVETGLKRATKRGKKDRIEQEKMNFFEAVRASYLQRVKEDPERFTIIDASQTAETVKQEIVSRLFNLLQP